MANKQKQYLLLDSWSRPLTHAALESPLAGEVVQLRLPEGRAEEAAAHEILQLVDPEGEERPLKCRLKGRRGEQLVLEKLEVLDDGMWKNLRIPVRFETLLYPVSGAWRGRRRVCSVDFSCGGVAFQGEPGLRIGEEAELVVPITEQPLLVRCEILRVETLRNDRTLYGAKFLRLCHDQEAMLRRAVFSVQLRDHKRRGEGASGETAPADAE